MCDGETQFHFNFEDRSFFVFCGSNHLRFEKTTTSAENCFLHTSLAADLPLNSIRNLRERNFSITQGNRHNSKINRKPSIPTYWNFFIFGLKGNRIFGRFFFLWILFCRKFLLQIKKNPKKLKKCKQRGTTHLPLPFPNINSSCLSVDCDWVRGRGGCEVALIKTDTDPKYEWKNKIKMQIMFLEKNALVVKIKACLKMSKWYVEKNTTMLSLRL